MSLQQIGQLLKSNIGVEFFLSIAAAGQSRQRRRRARPALDLLKDLGSGLAAFHQTWRPHAGHRRRDMSEFGARRKKTANRGTDHGHANCMFLMGGDVKGGQVYGKWPGLERSPAQRRARRRAHSPISAPSSVKFFQKHRSERLEACLPRLRQ